MVNVLSLPDDLLGRLAYPEGWHDFQWWITLRLGFQAPEMGWTGPGERGLIDLNSNEGSVQACPDLIWEIPDNNFTGKRPEWHGFGLKWGIPDHGQATLFNQSQCS